MFTSFPPLLVDGPGLCLAQFAQLSGFASTSDHNEDYELSAPILPGRYPQWVKNIHPKDKKRVIDSWIKAVESGSDFRCQWRYKKTIQKEASTLRERQEVVSREYFEWSAVE